MAQIQVAGGKYQDAEKSWLKVLELDPANPDKFTKVASFYFNIGQKQKAIDLANQALILRHDYVPALELKDKIRNSNIETRNKF